jgi:signal transduction histidine kinase
LEDSVPYHSIEDPAKLRRVVEATLLLEADLDLPTLLHHIVDEARSMTNARYGALGVLDEKGTSLTEFITVGLEPDEEKGIGASPTGRGVLGLLITDPKPLRLTQLSSHPQSYGFPPNHPPMTSFLGVPIKVRDAVYGNLYLTDKIGWSEFTGDDEALIGALAVSAGIAIENARLHTRVQEVAIYEERDRLARDLHDTVIQRLFAIGLSLQSMAASSSGSYSPDRLNATIADIDDTIRQVRTSIFELGSAGLGRGVRDNVLSLLQNLRPVVGFDVLTTFEGPVDAGIPDIISEHLLAVIREAITNIGRHARASKATVVICASDGQCRLRIIDDGCGMAETNPAGHGLGLGLGNLQRRAEKLHGEFLIESPDAGGTILTWQVPLSQ